MKKSFCLFVGLLVVQPSFATVMVDNLEEKELLVEPSTKIKIKEIKNYLSTINPNTTCMDEYIARRKQLILKLGLTPVTLAVGGIASVYLGVAAGAGVAVVTGSYGSWTAASYVLGGALAGPLLTTIGVAIDDTTGIKQLLGNDLILKALAESHLGRDGEKMDLLYNKVTKKMVSKPTKEEFSEKLLSMDASGELCDGSLVKQPRIKIGSKLKFKVARIKNIKTVF